MNLLDRLVDLERRPDARAYTPVEYNLDGFRRWMAAMGNPQDRVSWIHVAGTKGKGSTAALCEAILHAAGLRTALYTSPHLAHYGQRYRLDTREWTMEEFDAALARAEPFVDLRETDPHVPPNTFRTVFEVLTAVAFREFAEARVQAGVLEVGLGGRLDCTNIVTPVVSVITSIGLDHMKMLGNSLEEIASEKAGIIKPGVPLVLYSATNAGGGDTSREVILSIARERGAPVVDPVRVENLGMTGGGGQRVAFDWNGGRVTATLPLLGSHQLHNLGLALRACERMASLHPSPFALAASGVARGVGSVHWPGRFEILGGTPPVILDGAHCPLSARALARTLGEWCKERGARRLRLVWGMQGDKDHGAFLTALMSELPPVELASVHCYRVPGSRGAAAEALLAVADRLGVERTVDPDVRGALKTARGAGPSDAIVVAGSLYTLEDARTAAREGRDGGCP